MKKIILASDSFKGSLSSNEVNTILEQAARKFYPEAEIIKFAMSDGGEGLVEALLNIHGGEKIRLPVHDPLGRPIQAVYGRLPDHSAVIEIAAASGLPLLSPAERNPLRTSTYGTGELICDSLDTGCRKILLGLGGSATNDGGTGLAAALGIRFHCADGRIAHCGQDLIDLSLIDTSAIHPALAKTEIRIACDVTNPLFGPNGAAAIFAPQKGATQAQVELLDAGLQNLARLILQATGYDLQALPGAGAAGGAAAPLLAYTHSTLMKGLDLVLDSQKFDEHLPGCDLVITGEGSSDAQSVLGKVPYGIAHRAAAQGIPVIAVSGSLRPGYQALYAEGMSALFSACRSVSTLDEAMTHARENLEQSAEDIFRLLRAVNY